MQRESLLAFSRMLNDADSSNIFRGFHENPPRGSRVDHDEANCLFSQFANAPKNDSC